jgi:peptide/nickel transport system substrate-binding protein
MRSALALSLLFGLVACDASAQRQLPGTLVIVSGEYATLPVPTLMEGPASTTENTHVADLLFLRLAVEGPGRSTLDEAGYQPQLAHRWSRPDSLTLIFELDPRARWHDGRNVTAEDVVFAFGRAMNPAIAPSVAELLQGIDAVRAEGQRRVVISFKRAYPEQFFDATHYVQPLPAHLLRRLEPDSIATSDFARAPVGNGAFQWSRAVPGQLLEFTANPAFFLGRPGIGRIVIRVATDASARLNLLLSGEADALRAPVPPLSNREQLEARGFRLVTIPSSSVGYLLFNTHARGDSTRPHPILADVRVRRALILALDRDAMLRSMLGPYAKVPYGPIPTSLWLSELAPDAANRDSTQAARLLDAAGWRDSNGDGIRDRNGVPLALTVEVPGTSMLRRRMTEIAMAQHRELGIDLSMTVSDRGVWMDRLNGGTFDVIFGSLTQEPTPSAFPQTWSCDGSGNASGWCEPVVDSLMAAARLTRGDATPVWLAAIRELEESAPAAFLYAPYDVVALHRRFENVSLRPGSPWMMAWRWRVRRGAELPRDRVPR